MLETDISQDVTLVAGNCTVGFIDCLVEPPKSLGSGTLIRFGGLLGVLTCAHVLDALTKREKFGIMSFSRGEGRPQGLTVRSDGCQVFAVRGDAWSEDGPDLGFLLLPNEAVEYLSAIATFTNGDNRRRDVLERQPACDLSTCVVVGCVSEWTAPSVDNGTHSITQFRSLANVGTIRRVSGAAGFDFLEFDAEPEQSFDLPDSYQGVSGGGLWRLYFREDGDRLILIHSRLIGVAFYEKEGAIRCHGPASIYDHLHALLPLIDEPSPTPTSPHTAAA